MNVLRIYDKINRRIFYSDEYTGNIFIDEYQDDLHISLLINKKIFNKKLSKHSYLSVLIYKNEVLREMLDLTNDYVFYAKSNEHGRMIFSEKRKIKDQKSFVTIDRIYDQDGEFLEVENHKGNKTTKFKIKPELITKFLKNE